MKEKALLFFALSLFLSCSDLKAQKRTTVKIDMTKEIGTIRALNGGNLGPLCENKMLDMTTEFTALGIPIIRTHDVPWFSGQAVDIHTIFRDFRLDPADADNYDFRQTDDYLASLIATGAQIVYRLGESIEHSKNKYHVNPPTDNDKWAAICCAIIRHYTEGWSNGFHYDIKYWEIWNEPDIRPACWTGTDEQFFKLYNTTAKKIKNEFPDLNVGGPAIAHPVDIRAGKAEVTDFADKFLKNCVKNAIPLDFLSWHFYSDSPWESVPQISAVRKILDQYGFYDTESHMNEWNYIPEQKWSHLMDEQGEIRKQAYSQQSGMKGAAYIANVLMLMQDEPIDVANFYTTTAGLFGIFSEYGEPLKAYAAHKAFTKLLLTPVRIETAYDQGDSLVICAGTNQAHTDLSVLASNFSEEARNLQLDFINNPWSSSINYEVYSIDADNDLSKVKESKVQTADRFTINEIISSPSILLIKIKAIR